MTKVYIIIYYRVTNKKNDVTQLLCLFKESDGQYELVRVNVGHWNTFPGKKINRNIEEKIK